MPHDLGKDYVIVNLPDFTLRVFHDGQQIWMTRIVTGKPAHGDADHDRGNEVHHGQPDLERAALDRPPRIPAGAGGRSDRAGADGAADVVQSGRQRSHLATAGRPQRARPDALQLPEQIPGLSTRHAGQEPVRARPARVQPRLHARAGSGEIRRGAAQHRAAGRGLLDRPHSQDDRQHGRAGHSSSRIICRSI